MSIKSLGEQVGNTVTGGVTGMGISALDEMIFGQKRRSNQLEQQDRLQQQQAQWGMAMMNHQNKLQKELWEDTNYKAQVEQLKKAGLNPAMIYGDGGGGGVTGSGGMGAIGSGSASDEASQKRASIEQQGMGIEMAMMNAQRKKIEAETEEIKASAELTKEKSTTESDQREIMIENIRQQGLEKWLENVQQKYKMQGIPETAEGTGWSSNAKLNEEIFVNEGAYIQRELTTAILKTEAEIGNSEANKLLTNKKAEGYFRELMNEIIKAEAAGQQAENSKTIALAIKLGAEFDTGEYTNWKTWTDLGIKGVGALGNIITKAVTKGAIK